MTTSPDLKKAYTLRRFFVRRLESDSEQQQAVIDDAQQIQRLRKVLRLSAGDQLIAIDGGTIPASFLAEITSIERNQVLLTLLEALPIDQHPDCSPPFITMGAALIKNQRWDWLIQKTTELGVHHIVPIQAARTVVTIDTPKDVLKKQERWQQIAQSAAEQSERVRIPAIDTPVSLQAFCASEAVQNASLKLVLLEREDLVSGNPLADSVPHLQSCLRSTSAAENKISPTESIAFALGPEGGWTPGEVTQLLDSGFQPVSLGHRILRSETAAATFLSAVNYEYQL